MTVTFDLWHMLGGALAGVAAVLGARGRRRLLAAALIGATTVFLLGIARGVF